MIPDTEIPLQVWFVAASSIFSSSDGSSSVTVCARSSGVIFFSVPSKILSLSDSGASVISGVSVVSGVSVTSGVAVTSGVSVVSGAPVTSGFSASSGAAVTSGVSVASAESFFSVSVETSLLSGVSAVS